MVDAVLEVSVERVYYCSGSSFVTGTDIAEALIRYAHTVAIRGEMDVVEVPMVASDGARGRISLLLTPTTQMSAESLHLAGPEVTDAPFVDRLRGEIVRLSSPVHAVAAHAGFARTSGDFDL